MNKSLSNKFILNKKIVDCNDCAFYSNKLCKKYGEKDSFTGKIIFYEAKTCRGDVFRCGEDAKHFIQKENKEKDKDKDDGGKLIKL